MNDPVPAKILIREASVMAIVVYDLKIKLAVESGIRKDREV